jgi:hypothetical protein
MYTPQGISHHSFQKFFLETFTLLVLVSGFFTQQVLAQFTENFSDGNFSVNPPWLGSASKFSVVSSQLKLLAPAVSDVAYLSTNSESIHEAVWEFSVRMDFNPSGTNYTNVYLVSDNGDLTNSLSGYFVSLGSVNDEISLYRQQGNVKTKIVDGIDGRLNLSVVNVKVKVTRSADGNWQLFTDVGNTGTFTLEGFVTDLQISSSLFSGVYCLYTSTRSDKFYFDDFVVSGLPYQDIDPPLIASLNVISSREISLNFSEEVDPSTNNHENFLIDGQGSAFSSTLSTDRKTIQVTFDFDFGNGMESTVRVAGIRDLAGNEMAEVARTFLFFEPSPVVPKDVIVTELLPDFDPAIGLPASEFIELYNRSENPIQLQNWIITDGSSSGHLSGKILLPHSYLLVVPSSSAGLFTAYANVMAIPNFPTLNNSGDRLKLYDGTGALIDSVNYSSRWYRDEDKLAGGWSLELIDPDNFCKMDYNWIASRDTSGGTPGTVNSVDDNIIDAEGPEITSLEQLTDTTLVVFFNERLMNEVPDPAEVSFFPDPGISAISVGSDLRSIRMEVINPIEDSRSYEITFLNLRDCEGNVIAAQHRSAFLNYDTIPPSVDSVVVVSSKTVIVYFSERVLATEAVGAANYLLVEASAHPETVAFMEGSAKDLLLTFADHFPNGEIQHLNIVRAEDINSNAAIITSEFLYFSPAPVLRADIVINEIFCDPTPSIGLPETEYVELYNRSNNPINLEGWTITDRHSTGIMPKAILGPRAHIILTTSAGKSSFSEVPVLGLNGFPSLNNSRDTIVVKTPDGMMIDSLVYSLNFYHDEDKEGGGWSMELRDPANQCLGVDNWKASIDPSGGSPGKQNSVDEIIIDTQGPFVLGMIEVDRQTVDVLFNEKISNRVPNKEDFLFNPPVVIAEIAVVDDRTFRLLLDQPLMESRMYTIGLSNVRDCAENLIDSMNNKVVIHYDTIAPRITQHRVLNATQIEITFSEGVDSTRVLLSDFQLRSNDTHPSNAVILEQGKKILLTFHDPFRNALADTLRVTLADINGNSMVSQQVFKYFIQLPYHRKDIIITEIFADPTPSAGLPEVEYIELFNRSQIAINLAQWRIADATSSAVLKETILLPGGYLIVCSTSSLDDLQAFGFGMGVSNFPSLNNSGEPLVLRNNQGLTIDSVSYSTGWYRDEEASEGGYSLELIDPENVCSEEENWIASLADSGGTPGKQNSVFASNPDLTPPTISAVNVMSPNHVQLSFNEKLTSQPLSVENFSIDGLTIDSVSLTDRSLRTLNLKIHEQLEAGRLYWLQALAVADCAGNISATQEAISFALAEKPIAGEVLVSEILFNPHADGADFVELYNSSPKYVDLAEIKLANYTDSLANEKVLPHHLLAPYSYLAVTTDVEDIMKNYPRAVVENCVNVPSLPSMTDEEGTIAVTDSDGLVLDNFAYSQEFHSPFLQSDEGVSLERIAFDQPNSRDNWRSASSAVGFATPGFKNSNNAETAVHLARPVYLVPRVFETNSGQNDFTNIYYHFDKGGMIANVRVYDSMGRPIRSIAENVSLSAEGFFRWDGDSDSGSKVSIGYYMVFFEVFDADGMLKFFKEKVAVASRH